MKKLIFFGALLLCTYLEVLSQPFTDINAGIDVVRDGYAAWGDMDNDGDLDVFVVGNNPSDITPFSKLYKNEGAVFIEVDNGLKNISNWSNNSVKWIDYDNDGDEDLFVGTQVYNNHQENFTKVSTIMPGITSGDIVCGDYDNDGWVDLAISGHHLGTRIYRNNAGIHQSAAIDFIRTDNPSLDFGDYDNDGDLDLLQTGLTSGVLSEMTRIYQSSFEIFTSVTSNLQGVSSGDAKWGDMDNDGDLDLLLIGTADSQFYTILYENQDSIFVVDSLTLPGLGYNRASVEWVDFNADGWMDFIISGNENSNPNQYSSVTDLYQNQKDGSFKQIDTDIIDVMDPSIDWGDFDEDGDLDLLLTGIHTDGAGPWTFITKVYRNDIVLSGPKFTISGDVVVDQDFDTTQYVAVTSLDTNSNLSYHLVPDTVSFANVVIDSITGKVSISSIPGKCGYKELSILCRNNDSLDNVYVQRFKLQVVCTHLYTNRNSIKTKNGDLLLFPNPVKNQLRVECDARSSKIEYSIYNILGEEIVQESVSKASVFIIDTQRMEAGIYLLKIRAGNEMLTKKFVKSQ